MPQDFTSYINNTYGTNTAESKEVMHAVMTKLLDIEASVARIRNRPKPTRPAVVADEEGIHTKHREVDAALGALLREALEPSEELLRCGRNNGSWSKRRCC